MFGKTSNKTVSSLLKRHARIRKHKVLTDVRLPYKKGSVHIDNIYAGYFGLLIVDSFGYTGELYGGEKDAKWALYEKAGKTPIENPVLALQEKVDAIRQIFGKEEVYKVDIRYCAVLRQREKKMKVFLHSDNLLRLNEFKRYIAKPIFEQDKGVNLDRMVEALETHSIK